MNIPGLYLASKKSILRAQRLGLLQTLVNEFSSIADFLEIVMAG
jgi:hypothetical protein